MPSGHSSDPIYRHMCYALAAAGRPCLPDMVAPITCWLRLDQWQMDGIWEPICLDWSRAFLDVSFMPVKKGGQGIGLTCRGEGSKLMLVVAQG
jgi:hypothetical protein